MTKQFYTIRDIAEELQLTERTVRELVTDGKLNAVKVAGKWIVSIEEYKKLGQAAD